MSKDFDHHVEVLNLFQQMDDSINMIAFMNTAIVAICAQAPSLGIGEDELLGMQDILFHIEKKMRGIDKCLVENIHLTKQNQG